MNVRESAPCALPLPCGQWLSARPSARYRAPVLAGARLAVHVHISEHRSAESRICPTASPAHGTMSPMRRLARRLFMPCSVVSLLLCVAVCVLWVRSYWAWDGIVWASSPWKDDEVTYQQFASVRTLRGGLFTSRFRFDAMPEGFEEPQGLHVETVPVADVDLDHDIWGFSPW